MPQITKPAMQSAVLRTKPAADYLGVSRTHLHTLVEQGELTRVRLGARAVGFIRSDLDAWLIRQRNDG